jgi:hypothetical protein
VNTRMRIAFACLTIAGVLAVALAAIAASRGPTVSCPRLGAKDPRTAMLLFLEHDVMRVRPELGFGVAGPPIRGSFECDEWATGNIPVIPFLRLDEQHTLARMLRHNARRIELELRMRPRPGAGWKSTLMLLDLARLRGRWYAVYFETPTTFGPGG